MFIAASANGKWAKIKSVLINQIIGFLFTISSMGVFSFLFYLCVA